MVRRTILELFAKAPQKFYAEALHLLNTDLRGTGRDFLISHLLENELLLRAVADPEAFPIKTAVTLAANLYQIDQQLDARLLRLVMREGGLGRDPDSSLVHVLNIIDEISDCTRLVPLLMRLTKHGNNRVRSKAILLLGRVHRNVDWLQQQLSVADPRYRANAIEGLLYAQPGDKEIQLLWAAATDSHHRVATTALRVLHHFGQQRAADQLVELTEHANEEFRAAAAWAFGEIGQRKFLEVVQKMARWDTGRARRAALKAASKLHALPEEPAAVAASVNPREVLPVL
ncbi:MAG: HEAT repeat domain-containing protein [Acidobacteria bacterium]|nr:HEAT repeat domain-containing protein [Acidobacteriota bacterium]